MNRVWLVCAVAVCSPLGALWAQPERASLRGTVTDPSGASVPGALVQLRGPGGERRATANTLGQYVFPSLEPGKYLVRFIAKGFSVSQQHDLEISGAATLDVQLTIETQTQVVNVEDEAGKVSTDAGSNASALVLGEKELAALSDDPDELEQQLQAMAGPAAGPSGGQIYIDGFSGGRLPPKSSIREVRINTNPYSTEFDRPGFGRIEIFTKPGGDTIRGQIFVQYNDEALNSRSPLLLQSKRPPYSQRFVGFNLTGPLVKQKASFGFDFERRAIDENAFILATTLDDQLNPLSVNKAILTPQVRTTFGPRLDWALNSNNTLVFRYQNGRSSQENEGVGNYGLESRAYNQTDSDHAFQVTETAVLGTSAINETRFQFLRSALLRTGDNTTPALSVQGAFDGGGAQIGDSGNISSRWELSNMTTLTHGTHTFKWGARLRGSNLDDTSVVNFGGTYTFFGGMGPLLDAANQPVSGTSVQLSALERYRRTLLFLQAGYTPEQIRALGGGASQFSMSAGTPAISVGQFDAGMFVNDDWRIKPSLTLSYGLRYETQTNISDYGNWAPRLGIAWGIDGRGGKQAKTVLRAGLGAFYDRIAESTILQARRFNGEAQQSYLILNPDFFPLIPSADVLASARQPQQLQVLDSHLQAPRIYQASAGIERQMNQYARLSVQYVSSRGVHMVRSRNINTPIGGVYPFGDTLLRILTESTGFSRTNQLIVSPHVNYKKIFLFGFYALGYGRTDSEGSPADPYNLRAEWGPSSFGDVRHRVLIGTSLPLLWKFSISPFFVASSGSPYNITTGLDTNGDGFTAERPALLSGIGAEACQGAGLVYAPGFGCFNLTPSPVTAIYRNYGRGPANVNLNLRLARMWSFGGTGESGLAEGGPPPGMGELRGPSGPPPGGPPPGGPGGFGGRGGPGGMFGGSSGKKYNLTLSISARNILNHANYAAPSGDLSSPFFGEYRGLAGFGPFGSPSTYNRKIDVQLRFTF